MPVTTIGPITTQIPFTVFPPLVEIKQAWSDDWIFAPDIHMSSCKVASAHDDLDTAVIWRDYGSIKQPWESAFSTVSAVNLLGWWVRIRIFGDQGPQTIWQGKISSESRSIQGHDDGVFRGTQEWICYGGADILRKLNIYKSKWLDNSTEKELHWIPPMNLRDSRKMITGNAVLSSSYYVYGGTSTWTNYHYLRSLLHFYVDEGGTTGPLWTIGGQWDLISSYVTSIDWGESLNVYEAIRKLVPRENALDFKINATDSGFEIFIFSLVGADTECKYATESLEIETVTRVKNPNINRFVVGEGHDIDSARVVRNRDQKYGKITALGARKIVCFSLTGSSVINPNSAIDNTLETRWAALQQGYYDLGASVGGCTIAAPTGEDHDYIRKRDIYRNVYQRFAAPTDWNQYGNSIVDTVYDYQNSVRETLPWIPLREGYDYTTATPVDYNDTSIVPDFLPPQAWIYDPDEASATVNRYIPVQAAGISISVLKDDLGVFLQASPNHVIAKDVFSGTTLIDPIFDYRTLVVTVAMATDVRLRQDWQIAGAAQSDGELVVEVPDAESWILAPNTYCGLSPDGVLLYSPSTAIVLRDDSERLGWVLVGAIARYYNDRARAEISYKGLRPFGQLVGQIMGVITEGGQDQELNAPITSVEWSSPRELNSTPRTIVRTGYAE